MVKIDYINNTCDVEGLSGYGEILILIKNGVPLSHLDYSDTVVEVDVLPDLLKPFGVDISFRSIDNPSKKLIDAVKKYLSPIYGEPQEEE